MTFGIPPRDTEALKCAKDTHFKASVSLGGIPKQPQKLVFKLRESCRIFSIASAFVFLILRHLRSRKFGALTRLKNQLLRLFGYKFFLFFVICVWIDIDRRARGG